MKKKNHAKILILLGCLVAFFLIGSIGTFTNSNGEASGRIFGGILFLIFAIIPAIPFYILLRKYLESIKIDRDTKKELEKIQYETEKQLKQNEILKQRKELEKLEAQNKKMQNNALYYDGNHNLTNHSVKVPSPSIKADISAPHSNQLSISSPELLLMKIDSLSTSGVYFENVACVLLKANGFQNVRTTKTSNDYGVDILAEKDGVSYAIQCKCYSSAIGNKAIQEIVTGKMFYKCMVAIVFTNSTFTKNAIETAKETQVILWDRTKLTEMISSLSDENLKKLINGEYVS